MHHPTDRITHTTAFVTPVVEDWLEREIAQWVHPMKDRPDDPSHHERTLFLFQDRMRGLLKFEPRQRDSEFVLSPTRISLTNVLSASVNE